MSTLTTPEPTTDTPAASLNRPPLAMWVALALVLAAFAIPLLETFRLAISSQVYSYIVLVPFMVGYLIYMGKEPLRFNRSLDIRLIAVPLLAAAGLLSAYFFRAQIGWEPAHDDYLAVMVVSFLCCLAAIVAAFFAPGTLRRTAYPLSMLIFMAPFPTAFLHSLESFLQHRSADVAHGMLALSGMPLLRDGTFFQLPGFAMQVAPECSGIRSTLALFITSIVAGYMLLKSPWRRTILAVAVIPLALLRNGFRIWTISELCVNVDPEMIHSFIHKKGGPIFFALSMIPFMALLLWLMKGERKHRKAPASENLS